VFIKTNKIIKLGEHRLICGDSTDKELVKEFVGKDGIGLIIADPPYGVGYVETKIGFGKIRVEKPIINDVTTEDSYTDFAKRWLEATVPHLLPKNSAYIFNSDKMVFALREALVKSGFNLAQLLIWVKNQQVIGRRDYLAQHELIAYGWHGSHKFFKAKDKSVLFYPKPQRSPLHPTTKPLGLIRRLILNSSKIGDTVYDPFGGSGTTLIACQQTKRRCLMAEIDPVYIKRIISRYKRLNPTLDLKT
jgi:DNA modification methylase